MLHDKETLKQKIIDQLVWDERLNISDIIVEVDDDKVVLRGKVKNPQQLLSAELDVMNVPGVKIVENYLEVEFPADRDRPSDKEIKFNVENLLNWNKKIDASKINVHVINGLTILEGEVKSAKQRTAAEELALMSIGTTRVVNNLIVIKTKE